MSTFLELKTELSDRGFDSLSAARRGVIVNAAVAEVDLSYPWSYREDSGTGVAPLAIPTLGQIEAVTNETQRYALEPLSYRNLLDWSGDLSETGQPEAYYLSHPAGVPTVATFRTNGDTIGVQFWRRSPTLSADGDTPLAPVGHHGAYIAVASRMAAVESGGDPSGWAQEADRALQTMLMSLLPDQLSGVHQRVSADGSCDW